MCPRGEKGSGIACRIGGRRVDVPERSEPPNAFLLREILGLWQIRESLGEFLDYLARFRFPIRVIHLRNVPLLAVLCKLFQTVRQEIQHSKRVIAMRDKIFASESQNAESLGSVIDRVDQRTRKYVADQQFIVEVFEPKFMQRTIPQFGDGERIERRHLPR